MYSRVQKLPIESVATPTPASHVVLNDLIESDKLGRDSLHLIFLFLLIRFLSLQLLPPRSSSSLLLLFFFFLLLFPLLLLFLFFLFPLLLRLPHPPPLLILHLPLPLLLHLYLIFLHLSLFVLLFLFLFLLLLLFLRRAVNSNIMMTEIGQDSPIATKTLTDPRSSMPHRLVDDILITICTLDTCCSIDDPN